MSAILSATAEADAPPRTTTKRVDVLSRVEGAVTILCGLLAVWLHQGFFRDAGALWRDEVNSVQLASMPTFAETWRWLPFDSFPVGFHVLLRAFGSVFSLESDVALRMLGLGIGLAILGALCLNARLLRIRWPLLSLALLGCNPMFVRYGDSMRAYGLGILLQMLTLGALWRFVEVPRLGRWLLATTLAVLSVHVVFYNAVLLFALCVAGAVTIAAERRWRQAAAILAVGLPAAVSLAVYGPMVREQHNWSFLVGFPVTLGWLWKKLSEVTGSPGEIGVWLWAALFLGAVGLAGAAWVRVKAGREEARTRQLRFGGLALVLMVGCYAGFLLVLHYHTQPWYYLSLLAPVALCMDLVFAVGLADVGGRWCWLRPVVAAVFVATATLDARGVLVARQTNLDLHAQQLNAQAVEGDLIVCDRWECAIPLTRYYHGKAALVTLPPLEDHRLHRYDLVLAQMQTPDAAAPVLARMEATLRAGHRVWLSGPPIAPAEGRVPSAPPPARMVDGRIAGSTDYYGAWSAQAGYLLREHAAKFTPVSVSDGRPVVGFERLPLTVFEGWQ